MSIQLFLSKLRTVVFCFGLGVGFVGIQAAELPECDAELQAIRASVPNGLKDSFDVAVEQKDHEKVMEVYARLEDRVQRAVDNLSRERSQSVTQRFHNAKKLYMDVTMQYLGDIYSLQELYCLKDHIGEATHVMRAPIKQLCSEKFMQEYAVEGITRDTGLGSSIFIPAESLTAEEVATGSWVLDPLEEPRVQREIRQREQQERERVQNVQRRAQSMQREEREQPERREIERRPQVVCPLLKKVSISSIIAVAAVASCLLWHWWNT